MMNPYNQLDAFPKVGFNHSKRTPAETDERKHYTIAEDGYVINIYI